MRRIGVLTSSRADYGIYQPLLRRLSENDSVELHIIVFGMHLMPKFGSSVLEVERDNYGIVHRMVPLENDDSNQGVVRGYAKIVRSFSGFWSNNKFDIVLALGDRFEMSAAVQSAIPFEIKIAHLHGGETTLGAIDNIYRDQITLASSIHLVAAKSFAEKVKCLKGNDFDIFHVGSMSVDGILDMSIPEWSEVRDEFNIPCKPFILITFHPETVGLERNIQYSKIIMQSLSILSRSAHLVITMPNADGSGNLIRSGLEEVKRNASESVSLVETFGRKNYFSAMQACSCLLGNTSSGILEAASFGKYVVNVGNRQKGRLRSENVLDVPFVEDRIVSSTLKVLGKQYSGKNVYHKPNSVKLVEKILMDEKL